MIKYSKEALNRKICLFLCRRREKLANYGLSTCQWSLCFRCIPSTRRYDHSVGWRSPPDSPMYSSYLRSPGPCYIIFIVCDWLDDSESTKKCHEDSYSQGAWIEEFSFLDEDSNTLHTLLYVDRCIYAWDKVLENLANASSPDKWLLLYSFSENARKPHPDVGTTP